MKAMQEFNSPVGQVVQADTFTQINHVAGRLLTTQERIELNNKVKLLNEDFGEPGWKTWRFLHRTIGVENVEAMCIGHRDSAHAIIDLLLERGNLLKKLPEASGSSATNIIDTTFLVTINSELTSYVKELKGSVVRLKKNLDAQTVRTEELQKALEQTTTALAKSDRMLEVSMARSRQADQTVRTLQVRKWRNLMLTCGLFFALGGTTIGSFLWLRPT